MYKKIVVLLFVFIGLLQSCNTTEPPPNNSSITLSLEDVSSIEVWIKLTTTNLQLPASVTLKQNNQTREVINLANADTVLYIDSLLPSQQYTFLASIQSSSHPEEVVSNEISVTTMDTTSHNFTWQTWTFGDHSSSVLNDVAIIDENNIWAVGEIYMNDSLGQPDPQAYNAVHWDGIEWKIMKVSVKFGGNLITPPLEGVFAFSNTDIWCVGSLPIHGDGNTWEIFDLRTTVDPNLSLSRAWGQSSNDIYFVGRAGSIAHYNGTSWQKIESGTDLHLYDIYGDYSELDDTYEILVTVANRSVSFEKEIFKITNTTTVTPLVTEGIPHSIREIWFKSKRKYYVCGSGLFVKNRIETVDDWEELTVSNVYLESIDGNDLNDMVICGDFGELLHFNGVNWRSYQNVTSGVLLLGIKIKDDLVVTVGINNPKAFVAIGRR